MVNMYPVTAEQSSVQSSASMVNGPRSNGVGEDVVGRNVGKRVGADVVGESVGNLVGTSVVGDDVGGSAVTYPACAVGEKPVTSPPKVSNIMAAS